MMHKEEDSDDNMDSYKPGGRVKPTGLARVHKGEMLLTPGQVKHVITKSALKRGRRKR